MESCAIHPVETRQRSGSARAPRAAIGAPADGSRRGCRPPGAADGAREGACAPRALARSSAFQTGLLLGVFIFVCSAGHAESHLTVETAKPGVFRVKVSPTKRSATGLLELVDARTGRCVKTLNAGSFEPERAFFVEKGPKVPAGSYRVRYREGLSLEVAGSLVPGGKRKWTNPTDLVITDHGFHVLDSGVAPPEETEDGKPVAPPPADSLEGRPYLYKFRRDQSPDPAFGDAGRVGPLLGPSWDKNSRWNYNRMRCITVDSEGRIYIGSIYHEALIFDTAGKRLKQVVGGWDNDPYGPKCTTWINSIAMGPGNRLYLPSCYKMLRAYDCTKDAFAGVLYSTDMPEGTGMDRMIASDGEGSLYIIGESGRIRKYEDTGKAFKRKHLSDPDVTLVNPTGPSASGGLLWVAAHGGPPLWDYDAGELALFWDTGTDLVLVDRFGSPGTAADKPRFLNPSSIAQTPDHLELWVVEDGGINEEGPPGNARIRKFKIASTLCEEFPVEIR